MKESSFNGLGGNRTGLAVFGAMTLMLAYMIWLGVSGRPMPDWLLWLTTVL